jgi:acyl-CoA synthetase (AMP-forming)/AMP-acid ligase II
VRSRGPPRGRGERGGGGFVQTRPGAAFDEAALQVWCEARLAPYKRPARIVRLDALPASSTGKIQKAPLRERAAGMEIGA